MNTQLKYLPILTTLALTAISLAPATAKGARFDFAPNNWKTEQPNAPPAEFDPPPPHSVTNGSIPHDSNFLGLDPQMLSHPAVTPSVQAKMMSPKTITKAVPMPFQASFGRPVTPPVMANLPKIATPLAMPVNAAKPVAARGAFAKPSSGASKSVSGHLLNKPKRAVVTAPALIAVGKKIEGYGKNVGYTPGAFLPIASGSGMRANADVHGKILSTHTGR